LKAGGAQWMMSSGGKANFTYLAFGPLLLGFGDFNGCGKTDVLATAPKTGAAQWRMSSCGTANVTNLAFGPKLTAVAFGDLDSDKRTDVFTTSYK
jgi:hypothetical protein